MSESLHHSGGDHESDSPKKEWREWPMPESFWMADYGLGHGEADSDSAEQDTPQPDRNVGDRPKDSGE